MWCKKVCYLVVVISTVELQLSFIENLNKKIYKLLNLRIIIIIIIIIILIHRRT
jgi:hypothetical protein